jgi:HMG (high mobility group) box
MAASCGMSQDGGAKKRKLSPYNKFVKKMFKVLQKEHPKEDAPKIMKRIGAEWQKVKK